MDKAQKGLAGEFYTLAQLTHRGLVATLTLGNTKGVDILVTNQDLNKLYKVEVKSTDRKPGRAKLFGESEFFMWTLSKKHEELFDEKLIYCFVYLQDPLVLPRFFIVPSNEVARYVKWQHEYWLSKTEKTSDKSLVRIFRIPVHDPDGYENNWNIFGIEQGRADEG